MASLISLVMALLISGLASAKDDCRPKTETVIVNGDSMSPLLKNQQELSLDLNYYNCHPVQVGDIVVFEIPGRKNRIIKKIFAIPGDKYAYTKKTIAINGKPLKNSVGEIYTIDSKMLELFAQSYPILPADSFFALGDQPRGTFDASRMGFIDRKQIVGKIIFP